jgi:hypothetical protein
MLKVSKESESLAALEAVLARSFVGEAVLDPLMLVLQDTPLRHDLNRRKESSPGSPSSLLKLSSPPTVS